MVVMGNTDGALVDSNSLMKQVAQKLEEATQESNAQSKIRLFEEAIALCDQELTRDPNSVRAYFYRGISKNKLGKYADVTKDLGEVIKLQGSRQELSNIELAIAYFTRGFAFVAMVTLSEENKTQTGIANMPIILLSVAEKSLRKAIELDETIIDAHLNLGYVLNKIGAFSEAIEPLTKVITAQPDNAIALNHRSWALSEVKRYQEAIVDLRRAVEIKPDFQVAHAHLGDALRKAGEVEEAKARYKEALRLVAAKDSRIRDRLDRIARARATRGLRKIGIRVSA